MKRIYKPAFIVFSSVLLQYACVKDDDYSVPELECNGTTLVSNMTPQDISATEDIALYQDNPAIAGDDIIEAYVTSSDEGGNFFKTLSFQTLDGLYAFSIDVDVVSTYINFEPGRKVLIKLNGLYTQNAYGSLEMGSIALSNGYAYIGRIPETEYLNYLNRSCTVVSEQDLVQKLTIPQLKADSAINKLVEITNVQFTDDAIGRTYYDDNDAIGGATNYYLEDTDGNTIIFRTSSFATFGGDTVTGNSGSIRGILTKYGDDYQLMIRSKDDLTLNSERF
jgi:hypothetical protein